MTLKSRKNSQSFNVVDLFSGAGGMSYGFHAHPSFRILAAADAEIGKPSMPQGALQCNSTYSLNMGVFPKSLDLSIVHPSELRKALGIGNEAVHVLCVCPPCTGFSRTNPQNHVRDDTRNGLVGKAASFATALRADIVIMENARELIQGNFSQHYSEFRQRLSEEGYKCIGHIHLLSRFGLPQVRERAIVIAARKGLPLYSLDDLWEECQISEIATTVRTAFAAIRRDASHINSFPAFADATVSKRLAAIPSDGGSWIDLLRHPDADLLLTDAMKRIIQHGKVGSYPDVYGRMSWDKPAPTIKRECAHIGNGRYAHPVENRLCTIREMATLQGFPNEFSFCGTSMANNYRHIGDAVPPVISYQLACGASWMLTGTRPSVRDLILPDTHLSIDHIEYINDRELPYVS